MNLSERIGPQRMLGVAVATAASIVMATATARAADETDKYYLHLHACNIVLKTNQYDTLDLTDLLALQKYIPLPRACDAFYKCVPSVIGVDTPRTPSRKGRSQNAALG